MDYQFSKKIAVICVNTNLTQSVQQNSCYLDTISKFVGDTSEKLQFEMIEMLYDLTSRSSFNQEDLITSSLLYLYLDFVSYVIFRLYSVAYTHVKSSLCMKQNKSDFLSRITSLQLYDVLRIGNWRIE
jgi:hypothetical protein